MNDEFTCEAFTTVPWYVLQLTTRELVVHTFAVEMVFVETLITPALNVAKLKEDTFKVLVFTVETFAVKPLKVPMDPNALVTNVAPKSAMVPVEALMFEQFVETLVMLSVSKVSQSTVGTTSLSAICTLVASTERMGLANDGKGAPFVPPI